MNVPILAMAMNDIRDDLISGAEAYTPAVPNQTPGKRRAIWGVCMAGIALAVLFFAIPFLPFGQPQNVSPVPPPATVPNTQETAPTNRQLVFNYAQVPQRSMRPFQGETNRIELTSEELFLYYGLPVSSLMESACGFREVPGQSAYALYTYAQSTDDLNRIFYVSEDNLHTVELYISKEVAMDSRFLALQAEDTVLSYIDGNPLSLFRNRKSEPRCLFAFMQVQECDILVLSRTLEEDAFLSLLESLISLQSNES